MRYQIDHDLHIHTHLSICSSDEGQTPESILAHAKKSGLRTVCITDHYWDSAVPCHTGVNWWYEAQNFAHISQDCPMPKDDEVQVLFGCETDLDSENFVGIPQERWQDFSFIIVSTTHFHHMCGAAWENPTVEDLARLWVERFDAVLNANLPFGKVGIAHLACGLICMNSREKYLEVLDLIPATEMERLFAKAAKLGAGIELNFSDMSFADGEAETILRMFRIAKACGCKFYFGSDAHERTAFDGVAGIFERAITLLDLQESDKFIISEK